MYYNFSRVIDHVIYRYLLSFPNSLSTRLFDSILLHRSYLSLLNAQKLKKKSGKEKIPASIFLSPFPKRQRNETFANVLTIDAREFSRVARPSRRKAVSYDEALSDQFRFEWNPEASGMAEVFSVTLLPVSARHRETSTDCKSGVSYRRVSIKTVKLQFQPGER